MGKIRWTRTGRHKQTLEEGSGHEGYVSKASLFHEGVIKEGS